MMERRRLSVGSCRLRGRQGFTLIEMIVTMAIIALLLTIALPKYFVGIDRSKDVVLSQNLKATREMIERFYGDNGRYPDSLGELVQRRYLRSVPLDPVTNSRNTWIIVAPEGGVKGQVADIHSGARGRAQNGRPYSEM